MTPLPTSRLRRPPPARSTAHQPAIAAAVGVQVAIIVDAADDGTEQGNVKIRKELSEPTTMEFVETPLQDAVDYLKDLHGIEIQLDKRALDEAGVGADTPVTHALKGISLGSALRLLLGNMPTPLTFVVRDSVLMITTPEAARAMVALKTYDVGDLVDGKEGMEALSNFLQQLLAPHAVSAAKPGGESLRILGYRNLLFVRAPVNDQEEVVRILNEIRKKTAVKKSDDKKAILLPAPQ